MSCIAPILEVVPLPSLYALLYVKTNNGRGLWLFQDDWEDNDMSWTSFTNMDNPGMNK